MKKESWGSSDQAFGVLLAFCFLFLMWKSYPNQSFQLVGYGAAASTSLVFSWLNPRVFHFPKKIWLRFGEIVGLIMTPFVMAILFYVLLTPLSFLMRIFGASPQSKEFSKSKSYWILYTKQKEMNFLRQF